MNKSSSLFIIPSIIILGLIAFLPAKTIPRQNSTRIIESKTINQTPFPDISARSALAMDLVTGKILYEKNPKEKLPLASLTKIISVLVVKDTLSPNDFVRISQGAIATEGESFLRVGEHFLVRDLLAMAMVESSNDAIAALVEASAAKYNIALDYREVWFLNLMQEKASSLGVGNMLFYNSTGLDISSTTPGALGSAEDLAHIAQKTYLSSIWRFSSMQKIISKEGKVHILNPTNILEGDLPQLIGSKTGFTDIAGGNLLILFEYPINHPVVIVVLGSTSKGRFDDSKKLFDYVKSIIQ